MKKITLENGTVVEISDESYEALAKGVKTKKPWRAQLSSAYYIITDNLRAMQTREDGDTIDGLRYLTGNYYRTEEEAKKALERQKAIGRVTRCIYELNDGWEPDWSDEYQAKYGIGYDHKYENFYCHWRGCGHIQMTLPYMATEEIADQIITEMKDDLRIIWGL